MRWLVEGLERFVKKIKVCEKNDCYLAQAGENEGLGDNEPGKTVDKAAADTSNE